MSKIVFVTCTQFPKLTEDDLLAAKALGELGVLVEAAIWDDPSVDWSAYSDVVIRSCWGYHLKPKEFLSWLTLLERAGTLVHNPVDVIRWNMEKTYLKELQEDGISIIPSLWRASGDKVHIADLLLRPRMAKSSDQTRNFCLSLPSLNYFIARGGGSTGHVIEFVEFRCRDYPGICGRNPNKRGVVFDLFQKGI